MKDDFSERGGPERGGASGRGFSVQGRWPKWTPGRGAGGRWKRQEEDFEVEEVPLEAPSGRGEQLWLWLEKRGRSTTEVAQALAALARVPPEAVGYAGLKDREALTRQAFTISGVSGIDASSIPGVRVLETSRTEKKLRVGALRGNRFRIRVEGADLAIARERLGRLRQTGMPNYYGEQRVGGRAPEEGRRLLFGQELPLDHAGIKFAISAWQAMLFNRVLATRGPRKLEGDILDEGVPTGPIFGAEMPWPTGEALALERRVLQAEELPDDVWDRFPAFTRGTRRRVRVEVDARTERAPGGFWMAFTLPAGSYASVLLEEVL